MAKEINYKGSNGLRPLWDKNQIQTLFNRLAQKAEDVIIQLLKRTGEEFAKTARISGLYNDQTGNLRSSIGYVIVKEGNILHQDFRDADKGTDKATGKQQAEQLAMDLSKTYNKGYVLICLAGMKYAVYVEAMENKDVVSAAALSAESFIKNESALLFKKLNENG